MKEETVWAVVVACVCALIGAIVISWHVALVRMNAECVAAGKDFVDSDCREAGLVRK